MRFALLFIICISSVFGSFAQKKELTNEDIWFSSKFTQKTIRGVRSMNDGEHFTSLDKTETGQAINKYSYKQYEKTATIVNSADLIPQGANTSLDISDYAFSPDENKLLISTEVEDIYRRSTREWYYIYDIQSKNLQSLSDSNLGKQSLAEFSPDGTMVAFTRDNNIFIHHLKSNLETQVTFDGEYNKIINGSTDWVYEEEFGFVKGFYWSTDSRKIAFYKFDESNVKQFDMAMYGQLYPEDHTFKYPKAGEDNSVVSVHVYSVESSKTSICEVGEGKDQYIPRIKWMASADDLCVYRLNRLQNHFELLRVNTGSVTGQELSSEVFFEEKTDTYIEESNYDNLTFLGDNKHFVLTSDRDGYFHLYQFDLSGQVVNQITKGQWDVQSLDGIDEKKKMVYYRSREETPMQSAVYSVKLDGTRKTKLTSQAGSNQAMFSKGMKYFLNYHSSANQPLSVSLHNSSGKLLKTLENNEKLVETLGEYDLSPKEFFTFTTSEDIELNGWMIKPPDFNENQQYPVIMYVYGGPGSNTVLDSWNGGRYLWHQMMAQKGFIVVSVDGRGTGYRGRDFKNITYKQLGYYETIDQIEAAKYLGSLDYVDESRIGIHGWSYGGYMTSLCITKGADIFNSAVAVAPVTSWRYYDTIYTERYMQKPQANASGYDDNSPINHVEKLRGSYLLVHGSADDNVHYQNTMEMITALVKANKQFDLFIYPDKNHGIRGGTTRLHLYDKMTNFLVENLKSGQNINILD